MMTALAQIAPAVQEIRLTVAALAADIETASVEEVRTARTKLRMAREWATIHKAAVEVSQDLLRIEIICLRRIARLDALDVLGPHEKTAAKFFADMTDAEVDALIAEFGHGVATGVAVYRRQAREAADAARRRYGRAFASGKREALSRTPDRPDVDDDLVEQMVKGQTDRVRAALAGIIEEHADRETPFTVSDVVDELMESAGIDSYEPTAHVAIRDGVSEVVRRAISTAPRLLVSDTPLPRFVTCIEPESEQFVRIPAHVATVGQLAQMVELRREQLRQDEAALASLVTALDAFAGHGQDERLGDILNFDADAADRLGASGREVELDLRSSA